MRLGGRGAKGQTIKSSLCVHIYTQKLYQKWISTVRVRCFKFRNRENFYVEEILLVEVYFLY